MVTFKNLTTHKTHKDPDDALCRPLYRMFLIIMMFNIDSMDLETDYNNNAPDKATDSPSSSIQPIWMPLLFVVPTQAQRDWEIHCQH